MKSHFVIAAIVLSFSFINCTGSDSAIEEKEAVNPNHKTNQDTNEADSEKEDIIPASKRIDLESKGIGPVKEVEIAKGIDKTLANRGKELFVNYCTACHKPESRFIGPAMKGVLDRRTPEWTMNMIINPNEMVKEDPLAKDLYIEFNGSQMTDQGIEEGEARAILEYFRAL